jgi:hypothetical protein
MLVKNIKIEPGQNLFDIAVQEYGSVEGVFLVMLANTDKIGSITDDLIPGQSLTIWPLKIIQDVVAQEESLSSYLPILMQWAAAIGSGSGSGGGGNLNDADYEHVRGDEIIDGIKTYLKTMKVNTLEEAGTEGINIEGFKFDDDSLDLGTF